MISQNNRKKFVEINQNFIDRTILWLYFDLKVSFHSITQGIQTQYDTKVSIGHIANVINKYITIMAELNEMANQKAAPYIQHISCDELFCKKFRVKSGVLYSIHDAKTSYTIASHFDPYKNSPNSTNWQHLIENIAPKNLNPVTIRSDLGTAVNSVQIHYDECLHFADTWHVMDKFKKIRAGIKRKRDAELRAADKMQKLLNDYLNPKKSSEQRQKLLDNYKGGFASQDKIDQLTKALDHVDFTIEMFYSYFVTPTILSPTHITQNYDTLLGFLEEVLPLHPTADFTNTLIFLRRNKEKVLAFTRYLQNEFKNAYQAFENQGVSFNDFWLTIAQRQYNRKHPHRNRIMQKLNTKYGYDLLTQMCKATANILGKLKLTTQVTEGHHKHFADYIKDKRTLSQAYIEACVFHLNHKKMHAPACNSRKGKSRFEVLTDQHHDHWLDMVMGQKLHVIQFSTDAEYKKYDILKHYALAA